MPANTYYSMHGNLRYYRGPAKLQTCVGCGAPAFQWSYEGGCADERIEGRRRRSWCPHYDHYAPRCQECHEAMPTIRQRRPTAKLSDDEVCEVRRKYATGDYTHEQLAAEYDMERGAMGDLLRGRNYKDVCPELIVRPKPKAPAASTETVQAIREMAAAGATGRAIAKEFGVSTATVSRIINRKSHKD